MGEPVHIRARLANTLAEMRARREEVDARLRRRAEEALQAVDTRALHEEELRIAGVPERERRLFAEGRFRATELAAQAVDAFMASGKTFLVLLGGPGTGKTSAACHALTKQRGFYVEALTLKYSSPWDEEGAKLLHRARSTPLLVLDEVRESPPDERWAEKLEYLLNGRHSADRRTILTTNLDKERLRGVVGPRVWDRFADSASLYGCGNKSLRGGP